MALVTERTAYVKNFENVRGVIAEWMTEHDGYFPTSSEFREAGLGWIVNAAIQHHGGWTAVRERMGAPSRPKPVCPAKDLTHVKQAVSDWLDAHPDLPFTAPNLARTGAGWIVRALDSYHGGFVRFRNDYMLVPVADEHLSEYVDVLLAAVTALRAADTVGFWNAIRSNWLLWYLHLAAATFRETGSLEAFEALADG